MAQSSGNILSNKWHCIYSAIYVRTYVDKHRLPDRNNSPYWLLTLTFWEGNTFMIFLFFVRLFVKHLALNK